LYQIDENWPMRDSIDSHPVISWLLTEGRGLVRSNEFLEAFALRLRKSGIEVTRVTTGVPILHPQIHSFSGLWQLGRGTSERLFRADRDDFRSLENSPIKVVYGGGGPVRCRPMAPTTDLEFPIVEDLRRDGITDYVALPVPFADGSHKALTLATTRRAGFTDSEIALFDAMMPALAFNLEVQALRRTARTLLDTYVGQQSGGRVLDGQIKRGMGETIHAVIWLCDLRGFTGLSESLPRDQLIEMLNQYFGPMCDAVEANNGEVLKFIGDAMLAIFPIVGDTASSCTNGLAAARMAREAIADENRRRTDAGLPRIEYGIALHVGDVMYGNIGSLDFTVIGPAVNLTARIETLCGKLGRPLLVSADFIIASGITAEALGAFPLKGVGAVQSIYAPRD
jgi:adenylate cyclase